MALAGSDLSSQQLLLFRALNHRIPEVGTALKSEGFPTQDSSSFSRRSNRVTSFPNDFSNQELGVNYVPHHYDIHCCHNEDFSPKLLEIS